MKRKVLIITMFFILIFSLSYVNAQEISNNTDMDDTLSSSQSSEILGSGFNLNNQGSTLKDLQDVVQSADIIALNNNYTYTDGDPTDGIKITGNKMIFGNNITIDGKNQARLFVFNSSAIYISGINFVNFKTNFNGAAIYSNGSSAVITDCTFENCQANDGGALYYDGISLLIVNSTFKNNEANDGGGAYITASSTIIVNSTFTSSNSKSGGGFYWKKTQKKLTSDGFTLNPILGSGSTAISADPGLGPGATVSGVGSIAIGSGSHAFGNYSLAIGYKAKAWGNSAVSIGSMSNSTQDNTMAFGTNSTSSGVSSISIGNNSRASENDTIAIGVNSQSNGVDSIAIGTNSESIGDGAIAIGRNSAAEGKNSISVGNNANVNGANSIVIGYDAYYPFLNSILGAGSILPKPVPSSNSIAIGNSSNAGVNNAIAVGTKSKAINVGAIAFGKESYSSGRDSIAIGSYSNSSGDGSIALGKNSSSTMDNAISIGNYSHAGAENSIAIGYMASADAEYSIAVGYKASARGKYSIVIGSRYYELSVSSDPLLGAIAMGQGANASAENAIALGYYAKAIGKDSIAIGNSPIANNERSMAFGKNSSSYGMDSIAIGDNSSANKDGAMAFGKGSVSDMEDSISIGTGAISGEKAIAIGSASNAGYKFSIAWGTNALANYNSIALGNGANAKSRNSIALGYGTIANGINSYALGSGTTVDGDYSIAWGSEFLNINNNIFTIVVDGTINSNSYLEGKNSILRGQNSKVVNAIASTIVGNNYVLSNVYGITAYNGLIAKNGTLLIVNSTFTSNKADEGAAIYGVNLTKVDVNKSSFKLNTANGGGAVFLKNASNVQFTDSEFISNTALNNNGGAVNASGSNISVIGSEFHDNSAYSGGAISVVDSSVFTVRNSTFEDNKARSMVGGAISLLGGAKIYNSDFNRNTARYRGGAIHSSNETNKATRVYYSNFDNNGVTGWGGDYYGGAIFYADLIENCNFTNNYAHSGGAIYQWKDHGYRLTVNNSTFINNNATDVAGAAYAHYGGDFTDCKFYDNTAGGSGGAIGGWNQIAQNCLFVNNRAKLGGAVGGESAQSFNSIYINNSASDIGGSIYGFNLIVNNNKIFNSTSDNNGGAIGTIEYLDSDTYWTSSTFRNNTIINASAKNNDGAVYLYDHPQVNVYKTTFDSNKIINAKAKNGGGLYSDSVALTLTNNQFENVEATTGGAVYNNRTMRLSNNKLVNSNADLGSDIYNARNIAVSYLTFIDNSTKYGSYLTNITIFATLTDDMGNTITGQNVTFEINGKKYYAQSIEGNASFNYTVDFASDSRIVNGSYAGSDLSDTVIKTGLIVSNLAKLNIDKSIDIKKYYVGDIAKYTIKLSNAENFTAYDVEVKDFLGPGLEFIDGKVSKGSYANGLWIIDELHSYEAAEFVYYCTFTKDGYINNIAYVTSVNSESNKSSAVIYVLPHNPDIHVVKKALDSVVILGNQARFEIIINNTGNRDLFNVSITEDSFDGLEFAGYVESSLWSHSIVNGKHVWTLNEVLAPGRIVSLIVNFNAPNSGIFVNNAIVKSDKTGEELVNDFVTVVKPEISVKKIALTPNVVLGNQARFEIIVNNTGSVGLSDVKVYEDSFEGLVFDSYEASSRWNYSNVGNIPTWSFKEVLPAGEWVSLIVNFITTANGTFTNHVKVESNMGNADDSADVIVLKPEMTIQKVTLTPNVVLGENTEFEIVVHNNGQSDLTGIVIEELPDDSLIYDSFKDNGLFKHSVISGVHTWTLDKLAAGNYAGLIVYYKTTRVGSISNTIVVRSNEIEDKRAYNTTNVLMPSFSVEKVALKPAVLTNNQTIFEVIVKNTGNATLHDVYITEDSFDGLVFDSTFGDKIWNHTFNNGKNTWILNVPLYANEFSVLFLRFNTTDVTGNLTNIVVAGSNETGFKYANATVQVFKGVVPEPVTNSSNKTSFELFKSVVTQEILVNGQVTFQVVIHNNGDTNLEKVILTELAPEGLIYDSFTDYLDLWTYNGDLIWSANDVIYPGEYVGFFITFNATNEGKFSNAIEVTVNDTNVSYANTSFDVLKPDFTIEKVLVENNIVNGNQATFEIVIHNIGKASLNNLIVKDLAPEGLIYDSFTDYLDLWTYNGDLTWTMSGSLVPGEYVAFFVVFNTTEVGDFTNVVVANSSECDNRYSQAVLSVLDVEFDISKVCLTPVTVLGNQVTFEITVQNTGQLNLSSLKLSEISFDGLIFDHYNDYLGHWIYNGDLTWNLAKTLVSRQISSLFAVFNTTDVGNFTNLVLGEIPEDTNGLLAANGDANSKSKFAQASVEVVKPEYVIEKIAINKTAVVGEQVLFEIVVKNTGKIAVDGIVISESEIEGLVFDHFIDTMNVWINDGMAWRLNDTLLSGEVMSLYVVYNTTRAGNFTNVITSGNLTANATVEVKDDVKPVTNPNISIITIADSPVYIGNTSTIKITVINTGDVDLSDVFVELTLNDGLTVLGFDSGLWTYENNRFSYNGILKVGESSKFNVIVNTSATGNLSSIAYAGFNNTQITNSTFVIEVLNKTAPADNKTDNKTDNGTDDIDDKVIKAAVGNNSTGNPLVLILLALLALVSVNVRRKK